MSDFTDDEPKLPAAADDLTPMDTNEVSPANQPLRVLPRVVVPAGESEVVDMLAEQSRYADDDETKAVAVRLLEAGYTVQTVARRLQLRATTVWRWANEPDIKQAVEVGKDHRRRVLGQEMEQAAEGALSALVSIVSDDAVNPRDRVKAATEILDRCGIAPDQSKDAHAVGTAVAVDISFDERLARIVATSHTKGNA